MKSPAHARNIKIISAIILVVLFLSNSAVLQSSPEVHQEIQNNQNMDEALKPKTSIDDATDTGGFGAEISDDDWETKASAAALTDENFSDVNGAQNKAQYDQDLKGVMTQTGPTAEEIERQKAYERQQIRLFEEEQERRNRLHILDHEKLNQNRQNASEASRRYAERANADGKWTDEEYEEYERLTTAENDAWQFTPEEAAEMERQNAVRTQVVDEIRRSAANMGGTSDAEIAERAQNANMVDAGTKTWRNATFTGRMVNEVGQDITAQRELGIKANNTLIAATNYLNRTDITVEQRAAAQQVYDAAHFARGAAADAISKDAALILLGTASDVAVLGAGRPVSIVAGKVGQGVRSLWNGIFGGTEAAAGAAGAEAGAALGAEAAAGTRAAGTEAGAAAGTRAAGTEAGTAGATGRTAAGEAAGEGSAGLKPSQMNPAQRQAYNDAKAQQAASEGWRSGKAMEDGGEHLLSTPPGALTQPVVGEASAALTQAEVNALFKPGANLTGEQIVQKADLLLTGYKPPVIGAPGLPPSGVVAGAADNSATVILSGQEAASGMAAEAGTIITKPGAAAAGSTTQAFPGTLPIPSSGAAGATTQAFPGTIPIPTAAPGAVTGAAAEAGTVITKAGGNAATGGTTQAFNQVLPTPGTAAEAGTIIERGGVGR